MSPPIAYIAHAISAPFEEGPRTWRKHLTDVQNLASEVAAAGYSPIVPQLLPGISHRECMRLDHSLVRAVDTLVVHESPWRKDSVGVAREIRWAREEGIPVVYSAEELLDLQRQRMKQPA